MLSNAYPISIDNQEFNLRTMDYDENLLQTLRDQHNTTHSFF